MKDRTELARYLGERAKDLLVQHIESAEEAALDADEAKAKVSLKIEWDANATQPKTKVTFNFTTSHKDEIESRFDPDQGKLFGDIKGADKVSMKTGDGPKVTLVNNWVSAGDRLPDDETLVEVEDEKGETWTGCFGHDIDLDATAFQCEDGEIILVENIVRWRHAEEEAVEV